VAAKIVELNPDAIPGGWPQIVQIPFRKRIFDIAPGNIGVSMDQVKLKKLLVL
jgi:hypothetical protein